jgi:hypothetical protein
MIPGPNRFNICFICRMFCCVCIVPHDFC